MVLLIGIGGIEERQAGPSPPSPPPPSPARVKDEMYLCFEMNIIFMNIIFIEVYLCIRTPLHFLSKYHPHLFSSFFSEPIRFLDNTGTTGLISNYKESVYKIGEENLEVQGSDHNLSHVYHDDFEGILVGLWWSGQGCVRAK